MTVTIVRVTADQGAIEVAAQVNGLVEDGGQCTAIASSGTARRTTTSQAFANTQSTDCSPMTVQRVPPGDWNVTVTYESSGHYGESTAMSVRVAS